MNEIIKFIFRKLENNGAKAYWLVLLGIIALNYTFAINPELAGNVIAKSLPINWSVIDLLSKYICNLSAFLLYICLALGSFSNLSLSFNTLELNSDTRNIIINVQSSVLHAFMILLLPEYLIQVLQDFQANPFTVIIGMFGIRMVYYPLGIIFVITYVLSEIKRRFLSHRGLSRKLRRKGL